MKILIGLLVLLASGREANICDESYESCKQCLADAAALSDINMEACAWVGPNNDSSKLPRTKGGRGGCRGSITCKATDPDGREVFFVIGESQALNPDNEDASCNQEEQGCGRVTASCRKSLV